ncbi:MAG: hypothetical protein GXY19_17580 [Phycisphaerae bacterium]|nr:hypothetical protein [Phycisphaerae bacterium]
MQSNQHRPIPMPSARQEAPDDSEARVARLLDRPAVTRLFDSWLIDLEILSGALSRREISEQAYMGALPRIHEQLRYYGSGGELRRDLERLEAILTGLDGAGTAPPEAGADPKSSPVAEAEKQDSSAPESGSGTEVATSNSKRMRKIRK